MSSHQDGELHRRGLIGVAALIGGLAAGGAQAAPQSLVAKPESDATRSRTSLHQEVGFKARPARVYDALMSSKAFSVFTGLPATIDARPGGAIDLFGGRVVGRNIELIRDRRIVQAWRVVADFPPGVYSLVKIELAPDGPGTSLVLDHTGFPEGHFDHLNAGWEPRYWAPLRKFLA